ncbi:hypothetical protein ml_210 [Mollivirus sibericum]|uniref:hypothetical protein n=1 Tax=Mollivirus sibericum TaxID=1678078 RepID=UPI0006B2E3FE|nr:hypothetical protein ml_210 [Mollivirus sibericum]ALD62012.1 hypothetical protein ml_210 [Mollivirus sibericum]
MNARLLEAIEREWAKGARHALDASLRAFNPKAKDLPTSWAKAERRVDKALLSPSLCCDLATGPVTWLDTNEGSFCQKNLAKAVFCVETRETVLSMLEEALDHCARSFGMPVADRRAVLRKIDDIIDMRHNFADDKRVAAFTSLHLVSFGIRLLESLPQDPGPSIEHLLVDDTQHCIQRFKKTEERHDDALVHALANTMATMASSRRGTVSVKAYTGTAHVYRDYGAMIDQVVNIVRDGKDRCLVEGAPYVVLITLEDTSDHCTLYIRPGDLYLSGAAQVVTSSDPGAVGGSASFVETASILLRILRDRASAESLKGRKTSVAFESMLDRLSMVTQGLAASFALGTVDFQQWHQDSQHLWEAPVLTPAPRRSIFPIQDITESFRHLLSILMSV